MLPVAWWAILRGAQLGSCYATGDVSAASRAPRNAAGGLVAIILNGGRVDSCYAMGDVTCSSDDVLRPVPVSAYPSAGGVAGLPGGKAILTSCYYSGAVEALKNGKLHDVAQVSGPQYKSGQQHKTVLELKALTAQSTGWSTNDWDFGDNTQLPTLKKYKEENGSQVEGELMCGHRRTFTAPRQPAVPPPPVDRAAPVVPAKPVLVQKRVR